MLLDLIRRAALALERGESGPLVNLAFFFKDPVGTTEHQLHKQYEMLERWVLQKVAA